MRSVVHDAKMRECNVGLHPNASHATQHEHEHETRRTPQLMPVIL
jgi:hypothetical protein